MKKRQGIAALMPLYIWTVAMVVLPMVYVLALSFMETGDGFGVQGTFTLSNFARLFEAANMTIFVRSLRTALITTVATLLAGYPFAMAMTTRSPKRQRLLMLLIVVPFWTSSLLRMYGWILFLRSNGILNNFLAQVGIAPIKGLLYNEGTTIFGMVYTFLPFMILPIYSSLQKLDRSLVDASRDLGAGPLRAFLSVKLPLTVPGIMSGCTMVFVPSIGMFFVSDLMGGGTEMLLGNLINHYLHAGRNWPFGAALSMVMVVMTFLTTGLYRKYAGGDKLGVF